MPPPLPPAPMDFRQLLAMSAAEREKVLAGRTPQDRQIIEAKLKEYDALSPEAREQRLRAVQLRLYLRPLMKVPPSNRVERIAKIPEPDRTLIVERLAAWDRLPAETQREMLENVLAVSVLVHPELALPRGRMAAELTPQQQAAVQRAVARWRELPEDKRRQLDEQFQRIFQLNEQETAKSLQGLSEIERRRIQNTLEAFWSLKPAQRDACIAGVQKFRELSPLERSEFLRNAELWQEMSPEDRKVWRELVTRFRTPRPPALPILPPALPRVPVQPKSLLTATND
jgi:hypothetical protein